MVDKTKKSKKLKMFIEILNDLLVNEEIKSEVLDKIFYFMDKGVLKYNKNCLSGEVLDKINRISDYIEIKNNKNGFICIYNDSYNKRTVTITQQYLNAGNKGVSRKEKQEYSSCDTTNIMSENNQEYIYDIFNNLVYDSNLQIEADYETFRHNTIKYSNIDNNFILEKNWYYNCGLNLRYYRYNDFFNTKAFTEKYVLYEKPLETYDVKYLNGVELSEEEFKNILKGEVSIEEIYKRMKPKIKSYLKDNDVIIS